MALGAARDDGRHRIDHDIDALVRRKQAECQDHRLVGESELGFGLVRFDEGHIGDPVRDQHDLVRRYRVCGRQDLPAGFRHDDDFRRKGDDLFHDGALSGARLRKYGVKRRDDRHLQAREQFDDVATGFTAENAEFMLKRYDVELRSVQEFRGLHVTFDALVLNFITDERGVFVLASIVRHRDDGGVEVGSQRRDGLMQIVGEGRYTAAARKVIADDGDTGRCIHGQVSGCKFLMVGSRNIQSSMPPASV